MLSRSESWRLGRDRVLEMMLVTSLLSIKAMETVVQVASTSNLPASSPLAAWHPQCFISELEQAHMQHGERLTLPLGRRNTTTKKTVRTCFLCI